MKVYEMKLFSVVVVYTILAGRNAQSDLSDFVAFPLFTSGNIFCVNSFSSLSGPGNDENVMSSLQSLSREWNAFDPRSPVIENIDKGDNYLLKFDHDTGIMSYNL
jgi:hypothetical protein